MQTWEITSGSTTYSLSDGNPFYRVQATGVGMAPLFRHHQKGPFQDGVTDLGFRLSHRYINLALFFQETSYATADDARDLAAHIFKPHASQPMILKVTRDNGSVRAIECHVDSIMDFPDTDQERLGPSQRFVVGLKCHNPVFYNPILKSYHFQAILQGAGGSQVPVPLDWLQTGDAQLEVNETFAYAGDWKTFPTITVNGPGDDIYIENISTGEVLDFTNSLSLGEQRIINLNYGYKTVVDETGVSKLSELSEASDLATFHIGPDPEVPGGLNTFLISIANREDNASSVLVQYYEQFLSL